MPLPTTTLTMALDTERTSLTTSIIAGLDPLVLQALMGHASLEATTRYVNLSPDWLAAEYTRVRSRPLP